MEVRVIRRDRYKLRVTTWGSGAAPHAIVLTPGGEQVAFELGDRLRELSNVPTLVLWGNEDRVICARDAIRCRDFHQRAEVRVARGVGHMLPLEAPVWTNGYIARFVDSLRPALREAA